MRIRRAVVTALACLALLAWPAAGCSSSTTGGGNDTLFCISTEDSDALAADGGTLEHTDCVGYTNLSASQLSEARSHCNSWNAQFVSACPTSRLLGCCMLPPQPAGAPVGFTEQCYYETNNVLYSEGEERTDCAREGGTWSAVP